MRELPHGDWTQVSATIFSSKHNLTSAMLAREDSIAGQPAQIVFVSPLEKAPLTLGQLGQGLVMYLILLFACCLGIGAFFHYAGKSADARREASRQEKITRENLERERHEAIENDFRSRDASLMLIKQLVSERRSSLKNSVNRADEALISAEASRRACSLLTGGRIRSWQGRLYSVSASDTAASATIVVDGITLNTNVFYSDSEVFRQIARLKPSTWRQNGDAVTIEGYFGQDKQDSGCFEAREKYMIELISIR